MPASKKRAKTGRPPKSPEDKRLNSIGFRPTPALKDALEGAAKANMRSITKEMESRLEASFHNESLLGALLTDHNFLRTILDLVQVKNALAEVFIANPDAYAQRGNRTGGPWGYHMFDRAVGRAAASIIGRPRAYEKSDASDMVSLGKDIEENREALAKLRQTPLANEIAEKLLATIREAQPNLNPHETENDDHNLNEAYRAGDLIGDIAYEVFSDHEVEEMKRAVQENNKRMAQLRRAKSDG